MDLGDLIHAMNRQHLEAESRLRAQIEAEWAANGEIRDRELLLKIGYSSQEFLDELLLAHPARSLSDAIENTDRAFNILSRSRTAFVDLAGKFHSRVVYNIFEGEARELALSEATREVYTYSFAAGSLVQAYRHMLSQKPDIGDSYNQLKSELFIDPGIILFMSALRNSNSHVQILSASPHYTITNRFEEGREVKSGITFDRNKIVSSKDWPRKVREFVQQREDLEVIKLLDEHFALVSRFKQLVLVRTGLHSDRAYRDFKRIRYARKVVGDKVSLDMILQMAVPKKLNPYEYLANWFTAEELASIYAFADHSKEQLEHMISLRDPFGFCDDHMRQELYKLFSVPLDG